MEATHRLKYDENYIKKLKGMVDDSYKNVEKDLEKAKNIFMKFNIKIETPETSINDIVSRFTNMKIDKKIINEFNKSLVDNKKEINIIEYGKIINKLTDNIDLSFLEVFIGLVDKEDFCIDAIKIYELKIFENINIKDKNGNDIGFHTGCFFKNILKNYKENIDFILVDKSTSIKKGPKTIKTYILTPNCFKKILMRNRNPGASYLSLAAFGR